jgi:uncharacterized repeat protein (TIGR03803 family)
MHGKQQSQNSLLRAITRAATAALATAMVFVLVVASSPSAQSQNYQVIHYFSWQPGGIYPLAGLTTDGAGSYYGVTGNLYGSVFKLARQGSSWVFTPLYTFTAGSDGNTAHATPVFGPDGSLYGTTTGGGGSSNCGTVFKLTPPAWTETVIYRFSGAPDGCNPASSPVTFDAQGNMYMTTYSGGSNDDGGAVIKLTPYQGGWMESVIQSFGSSSSPTSGVIVDSAGNLYGTLPGFYGNAVFQLAPSGSSWVLNILHNFIFGGNDGYTPTGGLLMDQAGNLYGTTSAAGSGGGGTVFELTPADGSWTFSVLYSFAGGGGGPSDMLFMDAAGSLYGTTSSDGLYNFGNVFKLAPSGNGWIYTSLHDFTGSFKSISGDGAYPYGGVILDSAGNLYGTTSGGGHWSRWECGIYGCGVVWEITP